jgi:hypothetical protein
MCHLTNSVCILVVIFQLYGETESNVLCCRHTFLFYVQLLLFESANLNQGFRFF